MSLTREQWEEMWKQVKHIEVIAINMNSPRGTMIMMELNKIKASIESVIGQQE